MKIKVLTNIKGLTSVRLDGVDFEFSPFESCQSLPALSNFLKSFNFHYILLNGALHEALLLSVLKWIIPFNRTKVVLVDILLSAPIGLRGRLKSYLLTVLLRKVHMFILYYKNTQGLRKYYGIRSDKFRYVPFKINQQELVLKMSPRDDGYIFCGGKTRRDFVTLFNAVKELDYPVKIVTTDNSDIAQHGSYLDESLAPANVEIVRLDGSPEAFISYMAAARLVILPIKPDICGAGIGVYIMAMALKKCVIISSGPGTDDVLSSSQAIVVPSGDSTALKCAIVKAFTDSTYRSIFENDGYKYAMSLQGEERLLRSIVSQLHADVTSK